MSTPSLSPALGLRAWLVVGLLMSCVAMGACSDDDGGDASSNNTSNANNTQTSTNSGTTSTNSGTTSANNTTGDVGVDAEPDADDDTGDTDTPDVPEPSNDQERIAFIPETAAWELEGLEDEVHVVYTEMGVPHVYASNRNDLGEALGFVVARDRYFVMDLQRRLGQGTISAILGDVGLENDIESRMLGMDQVTDLILAGLTDEDAAYLDAYARGINAYIEAVADGALPAPSELVTAGGLLGSPNPVDLMEPFTRRDVASMITVIMYETNFESGDIGRDRNATVLESLFEGAPLQDLRRAGAYEDAWEYMVPLFDAPSTARYGLQDDGPGASGKPRSAAPRPERPGSPRGTVTAIPKRLDPGLSARVTSRLDRLRDLLGRKEAENFGSNAWAVQGNKTTDGAALVAGDGHLQLSVPALMYQIGMDTQVFNASGGGERQAGLLITSLPVLAIGTNGRVAWSQVNPVADIVDWYREELQLDDDGRPQASMFQGEWRPLEETVERFEIADIPILESVGREETWSRWATFDGRLIFDIEGREVGADDPLEPGESRVNVGGKLVVPSDVDGDGAITALSFDYVALDTTQYVKALVEFTRADTVYDYLESSKGLVGNMLYATVADGDGNILYSSYQAIPCRNYLPRDEDGRWMPGADPTMIIDGTEYGGFTIPTGPDGKVDEGPGQDDPYRCVVPFDQHPQSINPPEGFVFNANNEPAPITGDSSLEDDPWYIGGPWSSVRAATIRDDLARYTADNEADIEAMAAIQANIKSRLGEVFVPHFVAAVTHARALTTVSRVLEPHEERLVALYTDRSGALDEAADRLQAWFDGGLNTPAGVETVYNPTVTDQDRADAVATMIFNAWLPRALQRTFDDEGMGAAWRFGGSRTRMRVLNRMLRGRGEDNPEGMASWNPETGESAFFDVLQTEETIERSDEILLTAAVQALEFLQSEPLGPGEGGFGTTEMDAWLWGLRHQVRFESLLADFLPRDSDFSFLTDLFSITTATLPLADGISGDDPRRGLKWFPRGGDNYNVDAASPGFSGTRFTHGSGPVMRMVIALKDGEVTGQNVVPGGQSGVTSSPHFADQAALWLGNDTLPIRFTPEEVAAGATGRELLSPKE